MHRQWRIRNGTALRRLMLLGMAACAAFLRPDRASGQDPDGSPPGDVHPLSLKEEMIRDRFERFKDRLYRLREELEAVEPENARRLERALQRAGELGLSDQLEQLIVMLRSPAALSDAADAQGRWIEDADRLLGILMERDSDNAERRRDLERLEAYRKEVGALLDRERELRDNSAEASAARDLGEQLDQAARRIDALLDRQAQVGTETARTADKARMEQLSAEQGDVAKEAARLAEDLQQLSELDSAPAADNAGLQAARAQAGEAATATQESARAMSQAGEALREADRPSAQAQQDEAERALRQARDRLQRARQELEPRRDSAAQAGEQRDVAKQTKDLAERMQSQEGGAGQQGSSKSPGGPSGQPTPGQQNLDQAEKDMQDAAESLDQDAPADAAESQQQAVEELEQALRELEDVLTQLRREEREETLRDLEARFREMLSEQRGINGATAALASVGQEHFQRAQQLELAELSTQERSLAEKASACGHILDEEGTTIVFPRVVGQVAEDMIAVADRLAAQHVGPLTQAMQQEIVETLEQLLEAVKRMEQENEQQAGATSSNSDNQPLLPTSAELKLLRSSQLRVNTRTAAIEEARDTAAEPESLLVKSLAEAAVRQNECAEAARDMRDRQQQP